MINFVIRSNISSLRHCEEWNNHLLHLDEVIKILKINKRRSNLISLIKIKGVVMELDKKSLNLELRFKEIASQIQ